MNCAVIPEINVVVGVFAERGDEPSSVKIVRISYFSYFLQ
jgi:hypothetical protein